jgi:hypothetical protein
MNNLAYYRAMTRISLFWLCAWSVGWASWLMRMRP